MTHDGRAGSNGEQGPASDLTAAALMAAALMAAALAALHEYVNHHMHGRSFKDVKAVSVECQHFPCHGAAFASTDIELAAGPDRGAIT
ncbi:hypothetical protein EYF80_016614 [Liparis tanakae]|uniref:Uncharacterized protein n=1 Tax=Liparis tanakae TaxID=230148 RepID=A0A4Z2I583_9TELE|nr:hypothetical protein EYF80_016614 [Liparis tanakae]